MAGLDPAISVQVTINGRWYKIGPRGRVYD